LLEGIDAILEGYGNTKFALLEGRLYIIELPSARHIVPNAWIYETTGNWRNACGLTSVCDVGCNVIIGANSRKEPDATFSPNSPWGGAGPHDLNGGLPQARFIVEIARSQDVNELREIGLLYLAILEYCRAFLGIKLWGHRDDGTWAAAAMLWVKDEAGVVNLSQAISFGTANISPVALANLASDLDGGLPPVTAQHWAAVAIPPNVIQVPQGLVLHCVNRRDSPGVQVVLPAGSPVLGFDLMDLQQRLLSRNL